MNDSCRKISRGQVWFLVDNDVPLVHTQGSVQGKNRPWLVVSNNQCNQSSPIYTIVPLTTAIKNELPTHVTFSTGDKTQTILCEQIRTVSQQAFFNAGSAYKWTMSEKYMALVDEALAIQLGLSLIFPKSEQFWESLERLIRTRVKQAIADSKVEALDISKIATLLDARVEEAIKNEVEPQVEEPAKKEEPEQETTSLEPKRILCLSRSRCEDVGPMRANWNSLNITTLTAQRKQQKNTAFKLVQYIQQDLNFIRS